MNKWWTIYEQLMIKIWTNDDLLIGFFFHSLDSHFVPVAFWKRWRVGGKEGGGGVILGSLWVMLRSFWYHFGYSSQFRRRSARVNRIRPAVVGAKAGCLRSITPSNKTISLFDRAIPLFDGTTGGQTPHFCNSWSLVQRARAYAALKMRNYEEIMNKL